MIIKQDRYIPFPVPISGSSNFVELTILNHDTPSVKDFKGEETLNSSYSKKVKSFNLAFILSFEEKTLHTYAYELVRAHAPYLQNIGKVETFPTWKVSMLEGSKIQEYYVKREEI